MIIIKIIHFIRFIILLILITSVSFMIYDNRDADSINYEPLCIGDCVKKDITKEIESSEYAYILKSDRFSNFSLKYSDYTSTGAFYLTSNYKDDNGKVVRVQGISFNINKSKISWPIIGDAKIYYEKGHIYIFGNKKIFESVSDEFIDKLETAIHALSLDAYEHDDENKPEKLLNGEIR